MYSNLVRASGFQFTTNQRRDWIRAVGGKCLKKLISCSRLAALALRYHRLAYALCLVPPNRSINDAGVSWRRAPNERHIGTLQYAIAAVVGELLGQRSVRQIVLGNNHYAACILVEPVHDARPLYASDA